MLVEGAFPTYLPGLFPYFVYVSASVLLYQWPAIYNSAHLPSLSNSLPWLYFSLSTSYNPNIV